MSGFYRKYFINEIVFPSQISSGIDVASSLIEPEPQPEIADDADDVIEVFEEEALRHHHQSEFNEDEMLQIFLQKVDDATNTALANEAKKVDIQELSNTPPQESILEEQKPVTSTITSPSSVTLSRSNSMTTSVSSIRSPLDRHSFTTLLDRHNDKCSVYSRSINLKDVWDRYQTSSFTQPTDQIECPDIDIADETPETLGFEIVDVTGDYSVNEIQKFVQLACRLAREKGLDRQGFICKSCPTPLGIGDATRLVDFFDKFSVEVGHQFFSAEFVHSPGIITASHAWTVVMFTTFQPKFFTIGTSTGIRCRNGHRSFCSTQNSFVSTI